MGRIIFLVDMNAFYASCEMARNPSLEGKAIAVAGDPKNRSGIILAANYKARKYKVKTTMLIHEAKKLCPELVLMPPDHRYYEDISKKVMNILSRFTPVIEKNSIDEAWMDLTGCEALFGQPLDIAEKIMKDIMDELHLPCSIGISDNKFLSKMASEMRKPLGITEVWKKDVKDKIWPLPVRQMYGIGKQTEKKLAELSIPTIGDIAACDRNMLIKIFGKYGGELHSLANGIDYSPVDSSARQDSKSISRSTTLPRDITEVEHAKTIIMELAEEVGAEARKYGYKGRTVSIIIKYGDFQSITRQKSIEPTYLTREIYQTGAELIINNWNKKRPVRLLGIGLSNFCHENVEQLSLLDISGNKEDNIKEERLEQAMDLIREKYGLDKIKRGKLIQAVTRENL